ncbi:MAG: serine/threonine protein kinase, partial [Planctomycetales bacterium]|nr:serine/threonine protein kinase [Planctomycetales bacterium]
MAKHPLAHSPDELAARIAELEDRLEAGESVVAEETLAGLKAQLDTLASELRQPAAVDPFERESACVQASEFVRRFGLEVEAATVRLQAGGAAVGASSAARATPMGSLGAYDLLEKIGEGGMGAVYKARHTKLDKIVAIKVLPAQRLKDRSAVARFEREMRAVGKLEHPNIVRAMDAGEVDGTHFLVMEYVKGADLSQIVKQLGPLPIADACELIRQAAVGLDEAHDLGMVHRDIKPSNIMLCQRTGKRKPPVAKILDMGLAQLSEAHAADAGLTTTGQMMGTLDYMAPEQGGDSKNVDIRADIYALGASLYRLLTGEVIYHGEKYSTPVQKMMALATQPAPPIQSRRSGVPDELA